MLNLVQPRSSVSHTFFSLVTLLFVSGSSEEILQWGEGPGGVVCGFLTSDVQARSPDNVVPAMPAMIRYALVPTRSRSWLRFRKPGFRKLGDSRKQGPGNQAIPETARLRRLPSRDSGNREPRD